MDKLQWSKQTMTHDCRPIFHEGEVVTVDLPVDIHTAKWTGIIRGFRQEYDKDEPDAQHLNDEKSRLFIVPGITSVDEISALRMILNCDNLEEITMQAP